MAENISLADQVIQALAEVRQMDQDIDANYPEWYVVRSLKKAAEQTIAAAMITASDLAWQAKKIRQMAREIKASKAQEKQGGNRE
jgi:hypothetical protein